jgi:hypothetical protein
MIKRECADWQRDTEKNGKGAMIKGGSTIRGLMYYLLAVFGGAVYGGQV